MATKKATKKTTDKVSVKVDKRKLRMPKTLAGAADALYEVKAQRLAAQKEIKPLAEFEAALKNYLIDNLPKSNANGISGLHANAKIVKEEVPRIEDEAAFMAFARKKGNEDLVRVVPNIEAILQRWDARKTVPGVGKFTIVKVSSTKLK
jgi:hypothetical protein